MTASKSEPSEVEREHCEQSVNSLQGAWFSEATEGALVDLLLRERAAVRAECERSESEASRGAMLEIQQYNLHLYEQKEALLSECNTLRSERDALAAKLRDGCQRCRVAGVAGDRCDIGNECGRIGCPECQQ